MTYLNEFHKNFPRGGQGKTHPFIEDQFEFLYNSNITTKSILDWGCGKGGTLTHYNSQYNADIKGYDPGIEQYASEAWRNRYWDVIYSVDVLEHIPLNKLTGKGGELNWIGKGIRDAAVFVIDLTPAKKTLSTGENAHCTLLTETEWLTHLENYFRVAHWEVEETADKTYTKRRRLCVSCMRLRKA